MRPLVRAIDDGLARVERLLVLTSLIVMSLAVFFDVLHRVASMPILRVTAVLQGQPPPGVPDAPVFTGPLLALGLAFLFFTGALRTAATPPPLGRAILGGFGLTVATAIGVTAYVHLVPNGLVWSQPLALGLLLWVSLLGATLATKAKAHITLEIADKVWKGPLLPYARLGSGLVAGTFCLVAATLSAHFASDTFEQWWVDGVGYMPGVPIPKFFVFLALPVGFLLMGLRFSGYAIGDFLDRAETPAEVTP